MRVSLNVNMNMKMLYLLRIVRHFSDPSCFTTAKTQEFAIRVVQFLLHCNCFENNADRLLQLRQLDGFHNKSCVPECKGFLCLFHFFFCFFTCNATRCDAIRCALGTFNRIQMTRQQGGCMYRFSLLH